MSPLFYALGLATALAPAPADLQTRIAAAIRGDGLVYPAAGTQAAGGQQQLADTIVGRSAPRQAAVPSARAVRGASPYDTIENEPVPKLVVDPPLPGPLAQGIYQAQYRVENLRIVNVFGKAAVAVSPRIGHLHVTVDDLPWWWADASDNNTVDVAGLPPGKHKVRIQLVDPNHEVFPGQTVVHEFTVPAGAATGHHHHKD